MRTRRTLDDERPTTILRNVVMHAQPHALQRPGRIAGAPRLAATTLARAEAVVAPHENLTYEQGVAEGLGKGRREGRAESAAAIQEATRLAVAAARAEAVDKGREEGLDLGMQVAQAQAREAARMANEQAMRELGDRRALLDKLVEGWASEKARLLEAAEEDLVALAHEAVCLVLGTEAVKPHVIVSMVRHLIARHGCRTDLAVHLHPDDLHQLRLQDEGVSPPEWKWVADATVQLGGAILQSPQGSLDARLEVQVQAMGEALLAVRRDRKLASPVPKLEAS